MIHGKNVIIYADGKVIALARECVINNSCEVIEVSSPDSGQTRDFIPGRKAWTCNISGLIPTDGMADYILKAGTTVKMIMAEVSSEKHMRHSGCLIGHAICTSTQVSCAVSKLAQGTTAWQGSGELEHVTRGTGDVIVDGIINISEASEIRMWGKNFYIGRNEQKKLTNLYVASNTSAAGRLQPYVPRPTIRYNYNGSVYMWDADASEFLPLEVFVLRENP